MSLGKQAWAKGVEKVDKEIEGIVEIGSKPIVERRATATGLLNLTQQSSEAIQNKTVKKGDVLEASTLSLIHN